MFSVREHSERLEIFNAGVDLPLVVQNSSPTARPFLHPMRAPDGIGIATQDAPVGHPWQHGLYFGLNNVNGVGFWTEGLRPKSQATDGKVLTRRLTNVAGGQIARWNVDASWYNPTGEEILADSVAWTLQAGDECYWLDANWKLTAKVKTEFGKHAYGGMFLRMLIEEGSDARLLSSNGATTPQSAEGQRARWMAVAVTLPERSELPADRRHVSMTLMDHPSNPEHPVPWRVDSKYGIAPSRCIASEWRLNAGESVTFRHRILVTIGVPRSELIEPAYLAFSENSL